MKLLGAREFLKTVEPGTLCVEFWTRNENECLDIINDFENGKSLEYILGKHYGEFYLFGDNYFSLAFSYCEDDVEITKIGYKEYDFIFLYDKNIIGDASPWTTLQVVFESEDEWPEEIFVDNCDEVVHKEDLRIIREWLLTTRTFHELSEWISETLEKDNYNNKIINYKGKR